SKFKGTLQTQRRDGEIFVLQEMHSLESCFLDKDTIRYVKPLGEQIRGKMYNKCKGTHNSE
ncbi:MAG: hypothetical protein MUO82_07260, partial [Candidatus Thermoplasmatota archaeon]|nr:hypothetical protein [Candidatus Thermoplasmatota archaeon]